MKIYGKTKLLLNKVTNITTLKHYFIMEGKHTAGQWFIDKSLNDGEIIITSTTDETIGIASLYCLPMDNETQANAKLIAAAPELLALVQWISKVTNNPEIGIKCDKAIYKATI